MTGRGWAVVVAVAVGVAFGPSLGGDWVWDDWTWQDRGAAALGDLWRQTYGGIWRPLSGLSVVPLQLVWPSPLPHKLVNLLLHLTSTAAVAGIAGLLGARPAAAWLGAATFALHPATTEAVCWVGARTEILPATLLLVGIWAWLGGRGTLGGLLLAAAPFAKEAYVVGVGSLLVLAWSTRRPVGRTAAIALLGAIGFVVARAALVGTAIKGATYRLDPLPAVGGAAIRGAELLLDTTSPDLWNPYAPAPVAGGVVVVCAVVALVLARGRPALGALLAAVPPLLPSALASTSTLLLADRYFYVPVAGIGVVTALAAEALVARLDRPRLLGLGALVPLGLAFATATRSLDWRAEILLARSSYERHPDNFLAAGHLAYAEERWGDGCAAALPLYRRAAPYEAASETGLVRCLVETHAVTEALARVPTDEVRADRLLLAARAAAELHDLPAAEAWARRADTAEPDQPDTKVQLGYVLGLQGRNAEALAVFEEALRIDPGNADARFGAETARRFLAASGE